jgi:hypothetical protein
VRVRVREEEETVCLQQHRKPRRNAVLINLYIDITASRLLHRGSNPRQSNHRLHIILLPRITQLVLRARQPLEFVHP